MTLGRFLFAALRTMESCLTIAPWTGQAGDPPSPRRPISGTGRQRRLEATKQYTLQQKEALRKTVQGELNELQIKIAELQKKTGPPPRRPGDMQKAIQDLEKKKDAARKKLEEFNASTSSAWSTLRDGMTAAVEDLKKSYKEAVSKLP